MSSPPPLLLLLLAVASAGAGPLDLLEDTLAPATPATPETIAAAPEERQAVRPATQGPASEGQYCTVDGDVYHNGARLPLSSGSDPCRACYCQGGEAVCTRLHCYRRPDCAPRHVAGRCCPKYDNCPPAPEDRVQEPRFKDASTQTDVETSLPTILPVTEVSQDLVTDATETATAGTATSTVTTESSTITTTGATATSSPGDATDAPTDNPTDSLPPGIDLHALHEHLPFLSPGDANGPNT